MNTTEKLQQAYLGVEKAMRNDGGNLAMHARMIANAARDLAEAAEKCVTERTNDPWPALPEISPINTQLAKV